MKNGILKFTVSGFFVVTTTALVANGAMTPTYTTKHYNAKHTMGFVPQKGSTAFFLKTPRAQFTGNAYKVPAKFSMRDKAGPVEDQGQCGSCWDFSLTTALRGTLITHGRDPGRLSFNYLLNCATQMQGCDGGDFTAADLLVHPRGAPKYGSDGGGYIGEQGKCVQATPVASTISYVLLGNDGGEFPSAPDPSFQDIAYVVGVLHQPVSIDIAVTDDWQNYSSGVYNNCSDNDPKDINHMVVIEGYDCEKSVDKDGNCVFDAKGNLPNGTGRWLIRNSWSGDWGEGGYITMTATDSQGHKCDAVASDALFFNVGN